MRNESLYRRLADGGNQSAKAILDEYDEEGSEPSEEMGDENSEEQETAELTELQSQVAALVAKAKVHSEAGNHEEAGDAHFARASLHEGASQTEDAMCAYRDAAASFAKKLKGKEE